MNFKNYGVQPLLDGMISYLPDPLNMKRHSFLKNLRLEKDICAMAFKIIHHPTKAQYGILPNFKKNLEDRFLIVLPQYRIS